MTAHEVLEALRQMGTEKVRAINARHGAPANQFGVKMGDIRTMAKRAKTDHPLALELWRTGNSEAMLLATLIVEPTRLAVEELETMVAQAAYPQLADWLTSYVVKQRPDKEDLRTRWMESADPMQARAGWALTYDRIGRNPEGLDLEALLDRLDREMGSAPEPTQWTMNFCLAQIGITSPALRERAIAIGERLGLYRDYPVSKGCTSPFAPIWIREMVARRQGG